MKLWCWIFGHNWLCIERRRDLSGMTFYEWTTWECGRCGMWKTFKFKTKRGAGE